jgi:ABC-2 type transport system permease protein
MFTLIGNEMKKLFSRKKTWVVVIGFILLLGLLTFAMYKEEQNSKKYSSPEFKIKNMQESITFENKQKEELQKKKDNAATTADDKKDIERELAKLETNIKNMEESIKELKSSSGKDTFWKTELKQQIESTEKMINNKDEESMPEEYKEKEKLNLTQMKYFLENDIKPVKGYELLGFNFANNIVEFLGMIFLAMGIAIFISDMVSGECTPPTMKFLITQPVSRGKVLLSKFIAAVVSSVLLIVSIELIYFLIVGLVFGFGNSNYPVMVGTRFQFDMASVNQQGVHPLKAIAGSTYIIPMWKFTIQIFLMQILFIITCASFIFLISTLFKSSMVSMGVGSIIMIILFVIVNQIKQLGKIVPYLFTTYGNVVGVLKGEELALRFQNPALTPSISIPVMIIWAVACYIIAHFVFTKKDILI